IKNALNINDENVELKLLKYISTIVEPQKNFSESYVSSFLRKSMLNEYLYDSQSALLLVSNDGNVIYASRRAAEFTDIKKREKLGSSIACLDPELLKIIGSGEEIHKKAVTIGDSNYIFDKVPLRINNVPIGFYVTLQDEVDIKDMETSLNKKLREKGFFAKHTFSDIKIGRAS